LRQQPSRGDPTIAAPETRNAASTPPAPGTWPAPGLHARNAARGDPVEPHHGFSDPDVGMSRASAGAEMVV